MDNPNEAICHYCGEKLPHEKCSEARKKPEPGEFMKKGRAFISQALNSWGLISVRMWVIEACDEIDRLTAENKAQRQTITALDISFHNWQPDGWKEYHRLKAELKAKNEEIKHLQKRIDFVKVNQGKP
ncbi:MAG: hypothetical protein IMZ61_14095 [Planctomycetes bacterium]|nr:hypothetical protein [Chloroflexota bacterium]MBE3145030.1 hypothetical protein [Planctomycetota bacterium]